MCERVFLNRPAPRARHTGSIEAKNNHPHTHADSSSARWRLLPSDGTKISQTAVLSFLTGRINSGEIKILASRSKAS